MEVLAREHGEVVDLPGRPLEDPPPGFPPGEVDVLDFVPRKNGVVQEAIVRRIVPHPETGLPDRHLGGARWDPDEKGQHERLEHEGNGCDEAEAPVSLPRSGQIPGKDTEDDRRAGEGKHEGAPWSPRVGALSVRLPLEFRLLSDVYGPHGHRCGPFDRLTVASPPGDEQRCDRDSEETDRHRDAEGCVLNNAAGTERGLLTRQYLRLDLLRPIGERRDRAHDDHGIAGAVHGALRGDRVGGIAGPVVDDVQEIRRDRDRPGPVNEIEGIRGVEGPPPARPAVEHLVPAERDDPEGPHHPGHFHKLARGEVHDILGGRIPPRAENRGIVQDSRVPDREAKGDDQGRGQDWGRFRNRPDTSPVPLGASGLPAPSAHVEVIDLAPEKSEAVETREPDVATGAHRPSPLLPDRDRIREPHGRGGRAWWGAPRGRDLCDPGQDRDPWTGRVNPVALPPGVDVHRVLRVDPEVTNEPVRRVPRTAGRQSEDVELLPLDQRDLRPLVLRGRVPEVDAVRGDRDRGRDPKGEQGEESHHARDHRQDRDEPDCGPDKRGGPGEDHPDDDRSIRTCHRDEGYEEGLDPARRRRAVWTPFQRRVGYLSEFARRSRRMCANLPTVAKSARDRKETEGNRGDAEDRQGPEADRAAVRRRGRGRSLENRGERQREDARPEDDKGGEPCEYRHPSSRRRGPVNGLTRLPVALAAKIAAINGAPDEPQRAAPGEQEAAPRALHRHELRHLSWGNKLDALMRTRMVTGEASYSRPRMMISRQSWRMRSSWTRSEPPLESGAGP